jgi:hypothetical protein
LFPEVPIGRANATEPERTPNRRTSRNVKRWQSGEMALRWTAAGMLEAERQFRRIIGYRDLASLAVAIERDLIGPSQRCRAHPDRGGRGAEAGTGGSFRSRRTREEVIEAV